ncbi:putative polypeptide N-acetylgalactosaminyltransferase 9 [Anopheles ziemanni]|uniref:putative polypeptide N-acetylgalactosaminyltransferase 9 n=1 Tax=Anopheles coustani TaxID=139045 RepID=UPI00265807E4|nr:putative polypeptide N-acetylgalactosaminyltransferase 9 [Anopheles coustani]XP_058170627.1 putative polypeptide N-acetylgalactosaminyltransferase 9 [Anopheles ziemanni]
MAPSPHIGCCDCSVVLVLITLVGLNLLFHIYDDTVIQVSERWNLISSAGRSKAKETLDSNDHSLRSLASSYSPPGHLGSAVKLDYSDREVASLVETSIKRHGFNEYAATLMSLRRVLPDLRVAQCKGSTREVPRLKKTSIVIVFFNEPWSVLVRTVHSVLDNTPAHLIDEILLVDDCSYLSHLRTRLEEYFRPYPAVRILRAPERLGLIRARVFGSKNTTAPLLTFLDAHVECTKGWLEPLVGEVIKNATTIAVPLIDRIDDNDMHLIRNVSSGLIGAFEWDLNFGWWYRSSLPSRPQPEQAPAEPFETPAMAGGIFTIARSFFARLGWYDEQFQVYGMENSELSIKGWMCGGKILTVPCSHVAHIRKRAHPFIDPFGRLNVTFRNSVRLAEVWMDEYRQIVYDVNGIPGYREDLFGSVQERKRIRARAGCQPFRNYLQRAYPEMPSPIVPGAFRGEVHNADLGNATCLTAHQHEAPFMAACDNRNETQFWTHTFYNELNSFKRCIDVGTNGVQVTQNLCHRMRGSQAWHYDVDNGQLRNLESLKCLAVDTRSRNNAVQLEPCAVDQLHQKWYVTLVKYEFWEPFQ